MSCCLGGAADRTARRHFRVAWQDTGRLQYLWRPGHVTRPWRGLRCELSLKSDGAAAGSAKADAGKEVCETWIKDGDNKVRVLVDGKEIGVNHW